MNLARLLLDCEIEALGETLARSVGQALALSRTTDVADATVVLSAMQRSDAVVTSDRLDLARIAGALRLRIAFIDV